MKFRFESISKIPPGAWKFPHFTPAELACKHCGEIVVAVPFLERLERLRAAYGKPMIVTSGYRCRDHNQAVSSTGAGGPHVQGQAVDVRVYGAHALDLVRRAIDFGFTGLGLHQRGEMARRYVHLDDLEGPNFPRPTIWTY